MNTPIEGQNFFIFSDLPSSEMVYIPPGTFEYHNKDGSKENVDIPAFWIGKYPVTQELWIHIIPENPSVFRGLLRPVENITLESIMNNFIPNLNALKNIPSGKYRLPSQLEWVYAACPGAEKLLYDKLKAFAWTLECTHLETKAIGLKAPNKYGLHDMFGNIAEYCRDTTPDDALFLLSITNEELLKKNPLSRAGLWGSFPNGNYKRIMQIALPAGGMSSNFEGFRLAYNRN